MPKLTLIVAQCCSFGIYCRFDVNHLKFDIGIKAVTLTPGSGGLVFLSEDQDNLQKELLEACHRWALCPCLLFLHSPGQRHPLSKPMGPTGDTQGCSLPAPSAVLCPAHVATFAAPSPLWVAKVTGEGEKLLFCWQDWGTWFKIVSEMPLGTTDWNSL